MRWACRSRKGNSAVQVARQRGTWPPAPTEFASQAFLVDLIRHDDPPAWRFTDFPGVTRPGSRQDGSDAAPGLRRDGRTGICWAGPGDLGESEIHRRGGGSTRRKRQCAITWRAAVSIICAPIASRWRSPGSRRGREFQAGSGAVRLAPCGTCKLTPVQQPNNRGGDRGQQDQCYRKDDAVYADIQRPELRCRRWRQSKVGRRLGSTQALRQLLFACNLSKAFCPLDGRLGRRLCHSCAPKRPSNREPSRWHNAG